MSRSFKVADLRNLAVFPNLPYRFSTILETSESVVLSRDFLGENPLHYYADIRNNELIVANNIAYIASYLTSTGREMIWERVRAVSGNQKVTIDSPGFRDATPRVEELDPTLQQLAPHDIDHGDLSVVGATVRRLLDGSIASRLETITNGTIGLLLSGGLDSMSVAKLLSRTGRTVRAYTLKVTDTDKDIVKSRQIAQRFGFDLVEVKITPVNDKLIITSERFTPTRESIESKELCTLKTTMVIAEAMRIGGSPKKDNLFCSAAMYLIAHALTADGITAAFCGEGPNEYFNDYGYDPMKLGYGTTDKGNVDFRESLTFGTKMGDLQLGRGGLAKHALCRMGKIFAHFGIRLESPYFDRQIAKLLTHVPHTGGYDRIKQLVVAVMFAGDSIDDFIMGTAKEKFQDGSGVSTVLKKFSQASLIEMFEALYGVRKSSYLE